MKLLQIDTDTTGDIAYTMDCMPSTMSNPLSLSRQDLTTDDFTPHMNTDLIDAYTQAIREVTGVELSNVDVNMEDGSVSQATSDGAIVFIYHLSDTAKSATDGAGTTPTQMVSQ